MPALFFRNEVVDDFNPLLLKGKGGGDGYENDNRLMFEMASTVTNRIERLRIGKLLLRQPWHTNIGNYTLAA